MPYTPEGPFLLDLFKALNEQGIDYCVERNYEGLPYDLCGHDLDILIRRESIALAVDIIRKVAKKHNGKATFPGTQISGLKWLICLGHDPNGTRWGVRIDLKPSVAYKGLELGNLDAMLASSRLQEMVRVQDQDLSLLFGFLDSTFYGRPHSRNNYDVQLVAAYQRSPEKIRQAIVEIFGARGELFTELLETGQFANWEGIKKQLKSALLWRKIMKSPGSIFKNKFINFLIKCQRLGQRPGIMVAVLGLDGAGKSTLIKTVRPEIERLLHTETEHRHWRPGFLPRLSKLAGREEKHLGPTRNPHNQPPSRPLPSLLRIMYYTLDYLLGFWISIYPALLRNPKIIFFDRYFYDYFIDPARLLVNVPDVILHFFTWLVPRPDLIIILAPYPEIYQERKPELTLEELMRQAVRLKNIAKKLKNVVWIDTSSALHVSQEAILSIVLQTFGQRLHWQ